MNSEYEVGWLGHSFTAPRSTHTRGILPGPKSGLGNSNFVLSFIVTVYLILCYCDTMSFDIIY